MIGNKDYIYLLKNLPGFEAIHKPAHGTVHFPDGRFYFIGIRIIAMTNIIQMAKICC